MSCHKLSQNDQFVNKYQEFRRCHIFHCLKSGPLKGPAWLGTASRNEKSDLWFTRTCPENMGLAPTCWLKVARARGLGFQNGWSNVTNQPSVSDWVVQVSLWPSGLGVGLWMERPGFNRSRPNWITGPGPKSGPAGKSESHGPENGVSRWRRPNSDIYSQNHRFGLVYDMIYQFLGTEAKNYRFSIYVLPTMPSIRGLG